MQVAPSTGVLNIDIQLFKKLQCNRTSRVITTTNPGNKQQSTVSSKNALNGLVNVSRSRGSVCNTKVKYTLLEQPTQMPPLYPSLNQLTFP